MKILDNIINEPLSGYLKMVAVGGEKYKLAFRVHFL